MSRNFESGGLPPLELWEAEALYQEVLGRARSTPDLNLVQGRQLGDFWEEGWARAPFEECLTLKQIFSIDIQSFIRKRSMTAEKLVAISYAIEKCISGAPSTPLPAPTLSSTPRREVPRELDLSWAEVRASTPPSIALIPRIVLREGAAFPRGGVIARISLEIPKVMTSETFCILWLLTEGSEKDVQERSGFDLKTIRSAIKSGHKAIVELIPRIAPEVHLHWSTALTGPGARENTLFSPYIINEGALPYQMALFRILVQGLGALPPMINKKPLSGHWTLHPDTAWKMIQAMKGSLKGSAAKKRDLLSLPFPFFDLDVLLKILA